MRKKQLMKFSAVILSAVMTAGALTVSAEAADFGDEIIIDTDTEEQSDEVQEESVETEITEISETEEQNEETNQSLTEEFSDSVGEAATTETDNEESYTDETANTDVKGITSVQAQLYGQNSNGTVTSKYVNAEFTSDIVSRRTMDNKQQTWRVVNLVFGKDDATLPTGNITVNSQFRIGTEDTETPVQNQMTVGNCYYINDDSVANNNYNSADDSWNTKGFGGHTLMHGESTETFRNEYYCIYRNHGKIIRYLFRITRQGWAGLITQPYYSEDNPITADLADWVYDEENARYMVTIAEMEKLLSDRPVQKVNENGTLGGKIEWECLISEDPMQPIYRDGTNIYISKAGQYNAYHASYAGVEYNIPIRFSYRFSSDEGATLQLEKLLTDGITNLGDYETIEEFTALFPKVYQEKAKEYYDQVTALKKTFDNTRTGTYRGDWDYSITGKIYGTDKLKKWVDDCESAKVDKAKELSAEIWENIFGLKDAREAINKYTDSDKLTGDRVIKMAEFRKSYLQELEKSYKNHTLEKLSDVEKLVADLKDDSEDIRKQEPGYTPKPPVDSKPAVKPGSTTTPKPAVKPDTDTAAKPAGLLKLPYTSCTKKEGGKAFSLRVTTTRKAALTFKSSNNKVVTVDKKGKVKIKGPGRALITVTGKASGVKIETAKITVTVKPSAKLSAKATAQSGKKLKVTWKRNKKASGYQIVVSTDKSFKKVVKTVNIKKNKTVKTTIKGLKKGKRYYVRIRSIKKAAGGNIYGSWCKTNSVKIKK
ncbi:fibronectin type III domain-containing protein [Blautia sp. HCP28S3_G10]|uniref:fibronectin type III domain-containing protein n=1 Tax=Blautia sp. HCP28S3_G10 TaxID=3438908 RepID=UPI003F8A6957